MVPGTEIISARMLIFVPFPVMHLLLRIFLSPCQAFLEIYTFLETNKVLTEFSPLLDFLRITRTADNMGAPTNQHLLQGSMFFAQI